MPGKVAKTGEQHLQGLRDDRAVFVNGKKVADVTADLAYRNAAKSFAYL